MSILIKDLSKKFGDQVAVNNISFEIGKGKIVGFLGPNGAGKSTTMKMITTYITPTTGKIEVDGIDALNHPMEVRKIIGYLPESNPLYYDMYVREYLNFVADIHQLGKNRKSVVNEMIETTGLQKEIKKKIGNLSKGYKQRVGLAQALIHQPKVLILDEPTSGLDPNQISDIRDLIIHLGKEKTVLLSTHIMQEVQAMCSRAIIINNGTLVADEPLELLGNTLNNHKAIIVGFDQIINIDLFTQAFLNDVIQPINERSFMVESKEPAVFKKRLMRWSMENDYIIESISEGGKSLESIFKELTGKI